MFKMVPISRKQLPENRPKVLSPEEMALKREEAKQRVASKKGKFFFGLNFCQLTGVRSFKILFQK